LYKQRTLPETAREDALHIAISLVSDMDYLLTWNCRHIANAEIQRGITNRCHQMGCFKGAFTTPSLFI